MKTCWLLIIGLFFGTLLQAQVSKTVYLTPGRLAEALTPAELGTVTHLTITGTMDARDFKTIHDEMPALSELDLEEVAIAGFTDTIPLEDVYYPANTIPQSEPEYGHDYITTYGLANLPGLTKVTLPSSLTAIGYRAFRACRSLIDVEMPASLVSIDGGAFMECVSLTSLDIPASVSFVGKEAFMGCSYLSEVTLPPALTMIRSKTFEECISLSAIRLPESVAVIEYRAFYGCTKLQSPELPVALTKIGGSAFENCSAMTILVFPGAVTILESQAFSRCTALTSVSLPRSVTEIGHGAFAGCSSLSSIYCYGIQPVDLGSSQDVFGMVDKNTCTLFVPKGTVPAYSNAAQWKDFIRMEEMPAFDLSATAVAFDTQESSVTVQLIAEGPWTAEPDQEWLTAEPASGTGNHAITLRVSGNPSAISRMAKVTITTQSPFSQDIMVRQQGVVKTVDLTAGRIAEMLTPAELSGITHLTLTGTMDARDFKVIRDRMPRLEMLDIGQAAIVAYSGGDGTLRQTTDYPADGIPPMALASWPQYPGKYSLTEIMLPESVTSIGTFAFAGCMALKELIIPAQVTTIGNGAFSDCIALTTFRIPSSVITIGQDAFRNCTGIKTMTLSPVLTTIAEGLFFNCTRLESIFIPEYVTAIGQQAFYGCTGLSVISMPHQVRSIESYAFQGCTSLKEVLIPELLTSLGASAFANCTALKAIYAYPRTPVDLTGSPDVFAGVDKNNCTLLVFRESRPLYETAEQWKDFLHIMDMEMGTEDGLQSVPEITCYPNPFAQQLSIEVSNPLHREVSVEIFGISGQKVKTLARAQKGQRISLQWNGMNESGQQVPEGVYLLKVNGEMRKVVKGGKG